MAREVDADGADARRVLGGCTACMAVRVVGGDGVGRGMMGVTVGALLVVVREVNDGLGGEGGREGDDER